MYYVCIENNQFVGSFNYEPNVPAEVEVIEITDQDYINITELKTYYFDIATKTVKAYARDHIDQLAREKAQESINTENREFLNSTDWKVLRHIRQKALGIPTSLSEEAYLALEQQRTQAAARIVNN